MVPGQARCPGARSAGPCPLPALGGLLHLRLAASEGHRFHAGFSADGARWTDLGAEQDGVYLPPWDRGVRVALTAGGAGGRFRWARITSQEGSP